MSLSCQIGRPERHRRAVTRTQFRTPADGSVSALGRNCAGVVRRSITDNLLRLTGPRGASTMLGRTLVDREIPKRSGTDDARWFTVAFDTCQSRDGETEVRHER